MNKDSNKWKEFSFSTDDNGQCYYFERWELLEGASGPRLAVRKNHHPVDAMVFWLLLLGITSAMSLGKKISRW
jgi:hypothetical protein